ncbi:lactate dehydrogenase [Alphaproteobacteria bacterium]|nr:lactate dehydrogenase [Alphaproteobacteria bacterium]
MTDQHKIVFFDTDSITRAYMRDKAVPEAQITLVEKSIDQFEPAQLAPHQDAEVLSVFVHSARVGAELLDGFSGLRLIAVRSTGFDNIDLPYCKARGIAVANAPRYGEATVAEYAFGLLLDLSRRIFPAVRDLPAGDVRVDKYLGFDLCGRTLGVIGTGAIGRHAIGIARGFGMKVAAYDPYPNQEAAARLGFSYAALPEVLAAADVITLHAPLTPEGHHMLNAAAFAAMKTGVVIVNTARGELIDTEALYDALRSGKVAAAGLDVLEDEDFLLHDDLRLSGRDRDYMMKSLYNLRLMQMPNVIITPHIAFNTIDAVHRILDMTLENITAYLQTSRPKYPVG